MRQLFKEKTGKFGSLISLTVLTAMLIVFWLAIPEFLTSSVGRSFAVIWAVIVIIAFIAHVRRLSGHRRRYYMTGTSIETTQKKDVRTRKTARTGRIMRG